MRSVFAASVALALMLVSAPAAAHTSDSLDVDPDHHLIAVTDEDITPGDEFDESAYAGFKDGLDDPTPVENPTGLGCDPWTGYTVKASKKAHYSKPSHRWKAGPGGTLRVTRSKTTKLGTSVTGSGEMSVSAVVASAKWQVHTTIEISTEATNTVQYERKIANKKYGTVAYGSWGRAGTWKKSRILVNCKQQILGSGKTGLVTTTHGFKYWETKD